MNRCWLSLLERCWLLVGTLLDTISSLGGLLISGTSVPESKRLPFVTLAQNVNAFSLPIESLNPDNR